jgi:hypothetical protein
LAGFFARNNIKTNGTFVWPDGTLEPIKPAVMRGLLERALAAWDGPRHPAFDYAGRVRELIAEWDRLLFKGDLPDRLREFTVKSRASAKRVVRAMLRRLDRIEGRSTGAEQRRAGSPSAARGAATDTPVLTGTHIAILEALREASPSPVTQIDLSTQTDLSRRTIGPHVAELLAWCLVCYPHGRRRKGVAITPTGTAALPEKQPDDEQPVR